MYRERCIYVCIIYIYIYIYMHTYLCIALPAARRSDGQETSYISRSRVGKKEAGPCPTPDKETLYMLCKEALYRIS